MAPGLILLAFLAILVALFVVRMRRRVGLASTGRHWAIVIAVFVVLVLALWSASMH
jgi:hypothetical protein